MADLLHFTPLRQETRTTIRARLERDFNAGRSPEADNYYDLTPGTVLSDFLEVVALEAERLWDFASVDVPSASIVEFAWGPYLNAHAASTDLSRNAASPAHGTIVFTADLDTIIPVGTQVSTVPVDADDEPQVFTTTEGGVVTGSGILELAAEAVEPGTAGNVAAGQITDVISPIEGIISATNDEAFRDGEDEETDDDFRQRVKLAYSAARGGGSMDDLAAWSLSLAGIGHVRVVPLWNGPGSARVLVTDGENNPVSTEKKEELQRLLDPFSAETQLNGGHTFPTGTVTVDSTTGFSDTGRIYVGTVLVSYTGKTSTTFTGVTGGSGSVADNSAVVQHGEGRGLAPPGSMVTVDTPAKLTVNVGLDVTFEDGYSSDGADGTIDISDDIDDAIKGYIDELPPGGEDVPGPETPVGSGVIQRMRVAAEAMQIKGVYTVNLSTLTLNASTSDLTIQPLQVPEVGTITIS